MSHPVTQRRQELATVRVSGFAGLPAVLRSLGVDPAEVLAEVGVELSLFDDPDNLIGYAARGRLIVIAWPGPAARIWACWSVSRASFETWAWWACWRNIRPTSARRCAAWCATFTCTRAARRSAWR